MQPLTNPGALSGCILRLHAHDGIRHVDRGVRLIMATEFGFGAEQKTPLSYDMIDLALVKDPQWAVAGVLATDAEVFKAHGCS